jgi:hypothetical protein
VSCSELLWQFVESLDSGEVDFRPLRRLFSRCGGRAPGAVRKAVYFAVRRAWEYYKDSPTPRVAYVQVAFFIWNLGSWLYMPCRILTEVITYLARAVSKYGWPKWPFLAMAAAAAVERRCRIPDAVAEALGPDEYRMLTAFLEQGRGVAEVGGRKIAVVKKKRHITIEDYRDKTEK